MRSGASVAIHWFRRDLRLEDNAALYHALKSGKPVQCVFIFDETILGRLNRSKVDRRVVFIHRQLERLNSELAALGAALYVIHGTPLEAWKQLLSDYNVSAVYANEDYEPAARERDATVGKFLLQNKIPLHTCKDQVIFGKEEVVKDDGKPYTVFTPYKNRYRKQLRNFYLRSYPVLKYKDHFHKAAARVVPSLSHIGFMDDPLIASPQAELKMIRGYKEARDFPALDATTHVSVHLRFGTMSIRELFARGEQEQSEAWTNELIWRDFYMQILWHFPHVVNSSFRPEYDRIQWRNNEKEFAAWCEGRTGYPMVDAGMRELTATGFMHNRVRMITASFLVKHLLIDWRWGEAWFAEHLLDFDLAANNGGWQWAAGCGTDAAPYFRIFNPYEQQKKFDPEFIYVKKWVPEYGTEKYPEPIVEHTFARERCLRTYQRALK